MSKVYLKLAKLNVFFPYILELDNNQHISFWLDKSLVAMVSLQFLRYNEKGTNKQRA